VAQPCDANHPMLSYKIVIIKRKIHFHVDASHPASFTVNRPTEHNIGDLHQKGVTCYDFKIADLLFII